MEKLFIPYELSLLAKEKGFDEQCLALYTYTKERILIKTFIKQDEANLFFGGISAPLYQQIIDWFREKYNIIIVINQSKQDNSWYCHINRNSKCECAIHDIEFYYEIYNKAIEETFKLL